MTEAPIRIEFLSGELEVRRALAQLWQRLGERAVAEEDWGTVQIVVGEVLNNVVEHAYGADAQGEIILECLGENSAKGPVLDFCVRDAGREMPGLRLPKGNPPDLECGFDELPEGGFGWFLVRSLVTGLQYRRESGGNELRFRIALGPATNA